MENAGLDQYRKLMEVIKFRNGIYGNMIVPVYVTNMYLGS